MRFHRLALPLVLLATAASAKVIDNDVPEGTLGYWSVDVFGAGETEEGDVTAQRYASEDVITSNVLYEYTPYVDVGEPGGAFVPEISFDDSSDLEKGISDDDTYTAHGSFEGENGMVDFTVTVWIPDGVSTMFSMYEFSSRDGKTALGRIRFMMYLDEDVDEDSDDDVLFSRGSAAARNLQIFTLDNAEVYGVSHSGAFDQAGGLNNATFAGWAAGPYDEVQENIEGDGQAVSPSGVVFDLPSFNHDQLGQVYGPEDTTSVLAWDLNGAATSATVLATLGGVPEPPESECTPGDIFPADGDGHVDLRDFVAGFRALRRGTDLGERAVNCGDVFPGSIGCIRRSGFFAHISWCADGDGRFSLGDAIVIMKMALGFLDVGCDGCREQIAASEVIVPGDLAPAGAPDGVVDIRDVVRALRLSVGLEDQDADAIRRGDVLPGRLVDGVLQADGDGQVQVADVVGLLRTAVGLQPIAWPERHIAVPLPAAGPSIGVLAATAGWPSWAQPVDASSDACGDVAGTFTSDADTWAWACVSDTTMPSRTTDLTFTYRGPAVDPASIAARVQIVAEDYSATVVEPAAEAR